MKVDELKADMVTVMKMLKHRATVDVSALGAIALHSSLVISPSFSEEEKGYILEEITMDQIEEIIGCQAMCN